jgi:hypothetical protein
MKINYLSCLLFFTLGCLSAKWLAGFLPKRSSHSEAAVALADQKNLPSAQSASPFSSKKGTSPGSDHIKIRNIPLRLYPLEEWESFPVELITKSDFTSIIDMRLAPIDGESEGLDSYLAEALKANAEEKTASLASLTQPSKHY